MDEDPVRDLFKDLDDIFEKHKKLDGIALFAGIISKTVALLYLSTTEENAKKLIYLAIKIGVSEIINDK